MKKYSFLLTIIILISMIITQFNNPMNNDQTVMKPINKLSSISDSEILIEVTIVVNNTADFNMTGNTPIIINLSVLAESFPISVDAFGIDSPNETDDNIKWLSTYVMYNGDLIPSQVDDIDGIAGYSYSDELVFQLPESLEIANGTSATFNVFLGTNAVDLPPPVFDEVCTIYEYTKIDDIAAKWPDMVGESYYMENGAIRACTLVEAAWSSGGLYELAILETGWDVIKMNHDYASETWKWTRFALIEQFIEQNNFADSNPFSTQHIITGPVRSQIQMQSLAPYGQASSLWGSKPGVYGLVTYSMYANLPWLDYTLEAVGENPADFEELLILFMNRDYGGGMRSTHNSVYIPGLGYLDRNPDDILDHWYQKSEFDAPWFVEKLPPGDEYFELGEPPFFDDWSLEDFTKAGYGMIFDDTGFSNTTWHSSSEWIRLWFNTMGFPFNARYLPFDKTVTNSSIGYMSNHYERVWSSPDPSFVVSASEITADNLPFDYISVSKPVLASNWVKSGETQSITGVTAISSAEGELNNTNTEVSAFEIYDTESRLVVLTGDLIWDNESSTWLAIDFDLGSLDEDVFYKARALFEVGNVKGASQYANKFWYGNSDPPEDVLPPDISSVLQEPQNTEDAVIIRKYDNVNVSCSVTDESGVESVVLSYSNNSGSTWIENEMVFSFEKYRATIPSEVHSPWITIKYKIIAADSLGNINTTAIYSYKVALEYSPGQGIIPLIAISGIAVGAMIIAFLTRGLHKQKYDKV